jgi:hypothetical protein
MNLLRAEVFESGTWNQREFTDDDLDGIVKSFDALNLSGRIPLKFGHDGDDARDGAPALGWVTRVYREGKKLLADFTGIPTAVFEAIKAGLYKFVSIELLRDVQAGNRRIPWTLDAVALLGATPPAVGTLRDLQSLTMARRPAFRFVERVSFTRDTEASLRTEIAALRRQLLVQQQDADVCSGRVLRAEVVRFDRKFRDSPQGASVEDWRAWVADVPRPSPLNQPRPSASGANGDARTSAQIAPDHEVAGRVRREVEASGGKLTFSQATSKVLRSDPELAERYRHMPGTV